MQTYSVPSFHHSLCGGNPRTISCHVLASRDVSLHDPNSFLNLWAFVCSDFFSCPVWSGLRWGKYFLISLEYSGIYFINNCNEDSVIISWKYARERKCQGWRGTIYDQKDSGEQVG